MRIQTLTSLRRLVLCGTLLAAMTGCIRGTKGGSDLWSRRADTSSVALAQHFWNKELHYCNYDSASDTTFHYWPQAHVLDVFTDWYLRTGEPSILELYDQWYEGVPAANEGGFWNPYYDDMEWNGIAALRAYQATGQGRFLEAAKLLWELILPGWNDQAGGGITWKKGLEWSKNACSNGPGAILAARLHQQLGRAEDLEWARRIYAWEKEVLFDSGAINDNINAETGKIAGFCLTYNQGTFIGAAVELYKITGERSYIDDAILAADYTLEHLTVDGGILQPEGSGDGGIFKGIFVRYFTQLILDGNLEADTRARYIAFLSHNAETLWAEGNLNGRFGADWRTRPGTPSAMTPQLSGCMLIESMALLEREGLLPKASGKMDATAIAPAGASSSTRTAMAGVKDEQEV